MHSLSALVKTCKEANFQVTGKLMYGKTSKLEHKGNLVYFEPRLSTSIEAFLLESNKSLEYINLAA